MADVELLPLPWTLCHFHDDTQEAIRAYARANVAHATAPLQAEVEALRAEVAKRDGIDPWAVLLRAQEAEARAERLAEALRWAERHCPCGARPESPNTHPHVPGCPISAALHPTAAQENDDA